MLITLTIVEGKTSTNYKHNHVYFEDQSIFIVDQGDNKLQVEMKSRLLTIKLKVKCLQYDT